MPKQCEILDTITIDNVNSNWYQSCTNKDGMIIVLDVEGEVYCFDPFGEKKLIKIQNLQQD